MGKSRHSSWLVGLTVVALVGRGAILAPQSPRCQGDYAPGVVLVGLHSQPPMSFSSGIESQSEGETRVLTATETEVRALRVPVGQECATAERLRHDPRVAFAELDYAIHTLGTPNDPAWPNQWGPTRIGAPEAWAVTTGASHVVVAVLDTGIQVSHEDLAANLWTNPGEIPDNGIDDDGNGKVDDVWGWRFYHEWAWNGEEYDYLPRQDNRVADDHGHGTHVAGIAGARINNGVGIAGMAGTARLMAVKVLDEYGNGWYSDLAQGIVYAVDNGADVINLSVGGEPASETLQEAVDYAHDHGVLVVAAAGNRDPHTGYDAVLYPAACEHALAVAATNQDDARPSFSNHGPQVDVAAPGTDIYSTWYRGNYFTQSGTSMATPHVSGLAALIWSARPNLLAAQVTEIITSTARDVNGGTLQFPGWDEYLGWGRIDAAQALSVTASLEGLLLKASRSQLTVDETVIITAASSPLNSERTVTFTASGGMVSPAVSVLSDGVATTTLHAGTTVGEAVVTGTDGVMTDSVSIPLLPGPVAHAVLAPSAPEVSPGGALSLTLTAADRFGNQPLDGTSVAWAALGGSVTPLHAAFHQGESQATFIAGRTYARAIITATVEDVVATTKVDIVPTHWYYLPVVLRMP